ncbi:CAP domain-containing protein [Bacillus sp. AK128]
MKKTLLSVVVAGTVLIAVPTAGAAQHQDAETSVVQSRYVVSLSNWNEFVQKMFKYYYSQPSNQRTNSNQTIVKEPVEEKQQEVSKEQQAVTTDQPPVSQPTNQAPVQTQPETVKENTNTYSISQFEQQVVTLTNQERAKYGLKALTLDTKLSEVARAKSSDMLNKGYFSHTSPTYGSPFEMMKQFGISYRTAGENIAMGQRSPQEVVQAWMNSEGHRKNILSQSFTHIGVGHIEGNYWTQMFIGK